jgi:hypothetical protein
LSAAPGIAQLPAVDYSINQDFGTVQLSDHATVTEQGWMNNRVVDVTSIDEMDLPRLDFLKLDVEGYEVPALTGARNSLQQFRPWIWVEYFITGVEPIKQSLQHLDDYSFFIVDYQNMLCAPNEKLSQVQTQGLQPV